MRRRNLALVLGVLGGLAFALCRGETQEKSSGATKTDPPASVQSVYKSEVQPLLQKYCSKCHGEAKPKGGIQLDKLSIDFVKGPAADLETWHDVLQNLHRGEMPPRGQPQPTRKEHGVLVDWLNRAFVEARQQRESTGGKIVMRRLTAYEFQNTLEDLLGMKLNYARDLLPEVPSRDGFLNNGSVLSLSSQHMRNLWSAAEFAMSKAIVTGPAPKIHQFKADQFTSFANAKKAIAGDKSTRYVLLPDTALMMPIPTLPTEGRFRIRVNLRATGPRTSLLAWFKVSGNNQTSLIFAKPEVSPSPADQTVEIFGNIEDIPVLADRAARKTGPTPYLCFSNVGDIHFFRGGNGSSFPKGIDAAQVKLVLGDPRQLETVPAVCIKHVEFEAPFEPEWPPSHHKKILFASANSGDEKRYSREVIAAFVERAYRRPVKDAEVAPFADHFLKIRPKFASFEEAMRETLSLVLISPNFLFLAEPRDARLPRMPLNDFEWATRLSYFLWNTMPDEELLKLARKGALSNSAVRKQQIDRMLADDRHWRFVETFTDQWWGLSRLDKVAVNADFHPDFDDDIKLDMRRESQLFFDEFIKSDLSLLRLIDADFTFLNNRLASHYRIPHGKGTDLRIGSAFQRVALKPEFHRGNGILSHGSVLLLNSDGVESHPIKRAVWIRNAIFDDPPPEPPADVPELNTEDRGKGSALTLKQRIEQHRSNSTCSHCHSRVDPWGIPLEQYDALGRFRTSYAPLTSAAPMNKKAGKRASAASKPAPVDACSELPDGHKVDGADGLKNYILTHGRERYARAIVRKTLTYALGRSLEVSDQPLVAELTRSFMASDFRFRPLVLSIVQCEPFLTK